MINNIRHKWIVSLLLFWVNGTIASASVISEPYTMRQIGFHFRAGSSHLEPDYISNRTSFDVLDAILERSSFIEKTDSLIVSAGASPDGDWQSNRKLAQNRAESIKAYIAERCPTLHPGKIKTYSNVSRWSELIPLVEADTGSSHQTAILNILSRGGSPAVIESRLRQLSSGRVWQYIIANYLPRLRSGDANIVFYLEGKVITLEEAVNTIPPTTVLLPKIDSTLLSTNIPEKEVILEPIQEPKVVIEPVVAVPQIQPVSTSAPLLAVKTNLLFDALTALNIEIEFPIGDRFSVTGEWVFPWWTFDNGKADSKRHCLQILNGNIEGKYWFGNRASRPRMTGWFTGLYVGAGLYDIEYNRKGYQGEFMIMGGISSGYAHTINKSGTLRMEYSLGIGYMQTDYRRYEDRFDEQRWHSIRQETARYSWFGPTKIKVSLVWVINRKMLKGGVR